MFSFGYGLSYSSFRYGKPQLGRDTYALGDDVQLRLSLTNSGQYDGEEVVQVYMRQKGDKEGPLKTLRAVQRIRIPVGETIEAIFTLSGKQLEWWDEGNSSVGAVAGEYELLVGSSSRDEDLQTVKLRITK